jgi:capsular polysaccharide transport system permease protein
MNKIKFIWFGGLILILLSSIYWGLVASDRYISESVVVLESPQIMNEEGLNVQALLNGGGNNSDLLLLKEYLLSIDVLELVEEKFNFSEHYSRGEIDFLSRLASRNEPIEKKHEFYKKVIKVDIDDYAKVLRISVQSYTPEYSKEVLKYLLMLGENRMNEIGKNLAEDQVEFLENQVSKLYDRLEIAKLKLIEFQNESELTSPTATVSNINEIIYSLEAELAAAKLKKSELEGYHSLSSPLLKETINKIKALEKQIEEEKRRVAVDNGGSLNKISSEFELVKMKYEFSLKNYSVALSALEGTKIEAARKLKQLVVIQSPTLPEYSTEPKRVHNIIISILLITLCTFIIYMMVVVIKEHRD